MLSDSKLLKAQLIQINILRKYFCNYYYILATIKCLKYYHRLIYISEDINQKTICCAYQKTLD